MRITFKKKEICKISKEIEALEKEELNKEWEYDKIEGFFEVKYRKNERFGYAQEAVDLRKQIKICTASDYFRISHRQYADFQIRYDVIAITDEELTWIKNAFMYHRKEHNNGYSFGM